ncbi:MAG: SpoIIE family protein phosphatase [Blastocatellia bacterium]|nr:SpoIIE family protein phosphatase [Blastocatellia bacterium]
MKQTHSTSRWLLWVLTGGAVFYLVTHCLFLTRFTFFWNFAGLGTEPDRHMGVVRLTSVNPDGPAGRAGIQVGDILLAPDGKPFPNLNESDMVFQRAQKTRQIALTIRKPTGEVRQYEFMLEHTIPNFAPRRLIDYVVDLLVPLICTLIGLYICWVRWDDTTAWFGGIFFLFLAPLANSSIGGMPTEFRYFYLPYCTVARCFAGFFFLAFFSRFPTQTLFATRLRWIERGYAALLFCTLPLMIVADWSALFSPVLQERFSLWQSNEGWLAQPIWFLGFGLALLNFIPSIRGELPPDQARRFRVLIFGILLGIVPLIALTAVQFLFSGRFTLDEYPLEVVTIAKLLFFVFPLSFAYTVVKHRVLGIKQLVRRSVQYVFLSRSYFALELLTLFLAVRMLNAAFIHLSLRIAAQPPPEPMLRGLTFAVSGLGLLLMWRVNPRLQTSIDRRFFRDAYQAQQVLSNLTRTVRRLTHTKDVLDQVSSHINAALHVDPVVFLIRGSILADCAEVFKDDVFRAYCCRHHNGCDYEIAPDVELPADALFLKQAGNALAPIDVYFNEPDTWTEQMYLERDGGPFGSAIERYVAERALLKRLDAHLLVPLATSEELLGVMCLGPKLSEEPYTSEDKQLLMAVAEATALRLENARLIKRKTEEASLKRELEIARTIQASLLPSCPPAVPGLQVAGYSAAANLVGGDYFDYFTPAPNKMAVAIGDVTGHGVSSGLLMALAKGGLQTQMRTCATPASVMKSMNELICANGGKRNLMTFCYALFDMEQRVMELANAGHPFPFHYQAARQRVDMLEIPAYPLGVRRLTEVNRLTISLAPDDVLVFYSDGIVEATNPQDEAFGFTRLEAVIVEAGADEPEPIQNRILEAVKNFTAGRQFDDDVTVIVVKISRNSENS